MISILMSKVLENLPKVKSPIAIAEILTKSFRVFFWNTL